MQYLSISVAVILLYTSPVFVVVLSALIFREPITRRKAAALLLTVIGCALVSGIFGGGASVTVKGFLLGLGSGFFYALYSIFGRFALRHCSSYTVTIYTFLVASAGALFLLRPAELAANFARPGMISAAALMIVVSTVAPYLLYTAGLAKVETGRASILACAEPVMATLLSIFALGEPFTLTAAAGVVCVLGAVWLLSR
jgi:drug/metabolite transporter (DMT)-like permease